MADAFLDTTILVEALLKTRSDATKIRTALARFQSAKVHRYAIKEFKAGPLRNFVWMHNKLVITESFSRAIGALHRMSLTPKKYTTATALEALQRATEALPDLQQLVSKYGEKAKPDVFLADSFRLALKGAILKAWKRREQLGKIVHDLPCYMEVAPFERMGLLEVKPTQCMQACCLTPELKARRDDLVALRNAILKSGKGGREDERRTAALKHLIKKDDAVITNDMCRDLGDAVFALFCPGDCILLTTNLRDHAVLAKALGKSAETP